MLAKKPPDKAFIQTACVIVNIHREHAREERRDHTGIQTARVFVGLHREQASLLHRSALSL